MALLDNLVSELPPLQQNADGVVCIAGTRVTLDTVIGAYQDGASVDEIALAYDVLPLADIYAVISYYLRHRNEVEQYLQVRQQQAEQIHRQNETLFPPHGLRERLLARRQQGQS
jgi:uncharacterized protein (DUF433 family)